MPTIDLERAEEVERRHQLLAAHLKNRGDDALLLRQPSNIAWLTCGGEVRRPGTDQPIAAVFVTCEARVILCHAVDAPFLFEHQLVGLGFQAKERPWEEDPEVLIRDLCRGRRVASDTPHPDHRNAMPELRDFRCQLVDSELVKLRQLGRHLAHAVEATAKTFDHRETEAEVAGQVAHRLLRHGITPVQIQVIADGRGRRLRHWGFSQQPVERSCVVSAIGRRDGLHCGVARTVCFGQPLPGLLDEHQQTGLVMASAIYFSQAGWELRETWQRVQRIYEKFGVGDEWRASDQGQVTGYEMQEVRVVPDCPYRLSAATPIYWHPSVHTAALGDTIVVHGESTEQVTRPEDWPKLVVHVKGTQVPVPDVLCRESSFNADGRT
ncbi:MAG: hypothetical protein DWQ34_19780 [Planctomycetota bacterium]|nr:MAG: hypothetical protein DWQ34_19780 [Planctomycetota bacterium]REK28937.1 MAG: hypothetical protein DWQ41_05140 [Planctomycetota bacterium]REK39629.1 MAG: hypothetical protein DWQ45_01805 [Planctomycetota bacterium]